LPPAEWGLKCVYAAKSPKPDVSAAAINQEGLVAKFQNILETIGSTPVVRINRLAPPGINLFVKIEAFNPLGSVKDRLALGVIEAAEKSGELNQGANGH
jgi:threonine dehydratase